MALTTFAAWFIVRSPGALVFGRLGDTRGCKNAACDCGDARRDGAEAFADRG